MIAKKTKETAWGVTVKDNSLAPEIQRGDVLWIAEDREFKSGHIGVVCMHDSNTQGGFAYLARRVFITEEGRAILKSDNPKYKDHEKAFGDGQGEIAKIHPVTGFFRIDRFFKKSLNSN
ncbi:MAG: S24 family peptidase [Verrucomicrobia bacterium]|jgi:phage repressor protein C with HTH and peptisase S24 domain|nr:S24 family peptidase [Verrucomicrobiota bacterium]